MSSGRGFAQVLLAFRLERGLSQEELADRSGISVRAIGDMERAATRRPQRATVAALATALGLSGEDAAYFQGAARGAGRPARPAGVARVRLPTPPNPIIGRDAEVEVLAGLVQAASPRLVTLLGPGGVGKTRLALEVAHRVATRFGFADAVDLSGLTGPEQVPGAIAAALGVPRGLPGTVASIVDVVGDTRRLLLLDNFEHLAPAALAVAELLAGCPGLCVLATSRTALQLRSEQLWPVQPLAVPGAAAGSEPVRAEDLAALGEVASVRLLLDRARAVRFGFQLTAGNAPAVVRLCRRLDGLPLALELAAAQLRITDPDRLADQLEQALAGLAADALDVPDRQRTLQATVAWSARRLGPDERRVLTVLGAFSGGAGPGELEAVLAAEAPVASIETSLAGLAAAGLISIGSDPLGRSRVGMLTTVREVAASWLAASELAGPVRARHGQVFLELLRSRAGQEAALDADADNIRLAVGWAISAAPQQLDVAAVRALAGFLLAGSRLAEARALLGAIGEAATDPLGRAHAWQGAGVAANESRDHEVALQLAGRAAATFEAAGEPAGLAAALTLSGAAQRYLGCLAQARESYLAALKLATQAGDEARAGVVWNNLGTVSQDLGDYPVAREEYTRSLQLKQRRGDRRGMATALANLGALELDLGRSGEALSRLRRSAEVWQETGDPGGLGFALALLSEALLGTDDPDAATEAAERALDLGREAGHRLVTGMALARLGDLAMHRGVRSEAATAYLAALEYVVGVPETTRAMERLAAARGRVPGEARQLLAEAARIRAEQGFPVPPAQRHWMERAQLAPRRS